ncbi:branched-chain amino acid ABC transporter permease [soil metagenome]
MHVVYQILFDSLLTASLYAIGAVGFSLLWGVLNVLNVSYGAFIMLGGYLAWYLSTLGIGPLTALPIILVGMFALGWLVQSLIVGWVVAGPHSLGIVLTYGLNLILVGAAYYLFSSEYRSVSVPSYLKGSVDLGGATLTITRVAALVVAMVLTGVAWWFMDRTETGTAIRATRQDPEAARLVGINVRAIFSLTSAIAAALAGAMGALIAMVYSVSPMVGDHYLLQLIIVTVSGGLGSVFGSVIGALLVGVTTSAASTFLGASYGIVAGVVLVMIILLVRPQGLFGRAGYEG